MANKSWVSQFQSDGKQRHRRPSSSSRRKASGGSSRGASTSSGKGKVYGWRMSTKEVKVRKHCECERRYAALKKGVIAYYNKSYFISLTTDDKRGTSMQICYCPFCSLELEKG